MRLSQKFKSNLKTATEYSRLYKPHTESYSCDKCFKKFDAMNFSRPFFWYQRHLKSHNDLNVATGVGLTKNKINWKFKCDLKKDDKICLYGFNNINCYKQLICCHSKIYK